MKMNNVKSKVILILLNVALGMCLAFSGIYHLMAMCYTFLLLGILLIVINILLVLFYRKSKEDLQFRMHTIILRIVAIPMAILFCYMPFFSKNSVKPLYSFNKSLYTAIYVQPSSRSTAILPDSLPEKCEDYRLTLRPDMAFPNDVEHFCISFYTDSETIERYENKFKGMGYKTTEDVTENSYSEEYVDSYHIPYHIRYTIKNKKLSDLYNEPIVYRKSDTDIKSGCIIDKDSGLVVIWA